MRRLILSSLPVVLAFALVRCTPSFDNGAVRIDLSSLYTRDALTGRTSKTAVPIDVLRYALLTNTQIIATGDIALDDSDTFSIEARAGTDLHLAVLGYSTSANPSPTLAYLGQVKNLEIAAGKETSVRIPFYPAGSVSLSLNLLLPERLTTSDAVPERCLFTATRTEALDEALDGTPWTQSMFTTFTNFKAPDVAADEPASVFGNNVFMAPTGTYNLQCVVTWAGQKVDLLGGQSFTITHNTLRPFTADVRVSDLQLPPVITPPIITPPAPVTPRYFDISTHQGTIAQRNLLVNGTQPARIVGVARTLDGQVDTTFSGRVRLRFLPVFLADPMAAMPVVFPKSGTATNGDFDIDVAEGSNGRFEVSLDATGVFAGLVRVVEVDTASGQPRDHNQGVALFRVDVGSTEQGRCQPLPLSALALGEASFTHQVVLYTENHQLALGTDLSGTVTPLDTHFFVGILAQATANAGWCALDKILDAEATLQYPGLTIGVSAAQGTPFDVVEYINPWMQPFFEPVGAWNGQDAANIPLFRLAKGQVFLPNALRASGEAAKLPGLSLMMNAFYRGDAFASSTMTAGSKTITVAAMTGLSGGSGSSGPPGF
jgi:hypothetical protein